MIQNAGRPNGQSHHDAGVDDAPGGRREPLDEGDDRGHPEGDPPGHGLPPGSRSPQSHAVQWRKQIIEGIVPLGRPNDEREGPLDDEGGEFFVKALVALGVGKERAAEGVQANSSFVMVVDGAILCCAIVQWNGI